MKSWILFTISSMIYLTRSDQNWICVKRYRGWHTKKVWKYIDHSTESTVQDRVLCEWKCFDKHSCRCVTYGNVDSSCKLDTDGTYFTYSGKAEYEISILRRPTVQAVVDGTVSNTALSNWTVDAARELCGKLDSQLMTYDELNNASDYSNSKHCGYVEGGMTVTFVPSVNNTFSLSYCRLSEACAFCGEAS